MRSVCGVLPERASRWHNRVVLTFPELTRKPALKTRRSDVDSTLRDPLQNGGTATATQFTRFRRQWDVTIEHLIPSDIDAMDDFVDTKAVQGTNEFFFTDERDPTNPKTLLVKFSILPSYIDEGFVEGYFRQTCNFQLREV
jgi:hypothetical protein